MQFILPYHNGPTSKCSMKCNRFDCCVQMEKTILFSLVVVVILANYCEYSIIKRQQPHHPTLLPQDRKIFNSFSTVTHISLGKMQFSLFDFHHCFSPQFHTSHSFAAYWNPNLHAQIMTVSAAAFAPRGRVELKAAIDSCVNRQIPTSNVQSTSGKRSPVKLIFLDVDGVLNSHHSRW